MAPSPVDLVSLNHDVLVHILCHVGSEDLLSTMSTCRHLLREGLDTLLGRKIRIKTTHDLLSFHNFLTLTTPASFAALRRLEIHVILDLRCRPATDSPEAAAVDILTQAVDLQYLKINIALTERDDMVVAVGSLANLHHLVLYGDPSEGQPSQLLDLLRAPLKRLSLNFTSLDEALAIDVIPTLRRFCNTLETIHIPSVSFTSFDSCTLCCPKVTYFKIRGCRRPLLSGVVAVFPNIQALVINMPLIDLENSTSQAGMLSCRKANLDFQRQHRCWESLVFVKANVAVLCTLALQCEVMSLSIPRAAVSLIRPSIFPTLGETILCSLRPRHLRLSFEDFTDPNWAELKILSGYHELESLQRLDIYVSSGNDIEPQLSAVLNALKPSRLRMLDLCFDFNARGPNGFDDDMASNLAYRATAIIPTLEYIRFAFVVKCRRHTYYWKVSRVDDRSTLEQVAEDDHIEIYSIQRMFIPPEACEQDCPLDLFRPL